VNKYPLFENEFDTEYKILLTTTNNTTTTIIKNNNFDDNYWTLKKWLKFYVCFYSLFSRQQKVNHRNFKSIMFTSYMLIFFGIIVSNLVGNVALPSINSGGQLVAQITSGTLVYALLGDLTIICIEYYGYYVYKLVTI